VPATAPGPTGAAPRPRRADLSPSPMLRAVRLWFGAASVLAPGLAERQAARVFLTPRRARTPRPPAVPAAGGQAFTLALEGFRLAGWSWGMGPAVLLIHGWSGSAADMSALAGAVVRAGFRAVLFDMPAHGRSAGRQTTLVEWVRALRAVERALGAVHAVVGHSFGAAAVTLALEDGLGARGAVLVAPPRDPGYFASRIGRHIGLRAERVDGMLRRAVERVGRELSRVDASRAARSLTVPALILHDPADREVPWEHARAIAEAWRGSRLVAREGAGHYRILSEPATLDAVTSFVAGLPRAAGGDVR